MTKGNDVRNHCVIISHNDFVIIFSSFPLAISTETLLQISRFHEEGGVRPIKSSQAVLYVRHIV